MTPHFLYILPHQVLYFLAFKAFNGKIPRGALSRIHELKLAAALPERIDPAPMRLTQFNQCWTDRLVFKVSQ